MTLKIQRCAGLHLALGPSHKTVHLSFNHAKPTGEDIIFRLSGRIEPEQLAELQRLFKAETEGQSNVLAW